jgi:hypothetical protein
MIRCITSIILACFLLTGCATTSGFGDPGTEPGFFKVVSLGGGPACEARDLDGGAPDLLDRWIYLSRQRAAGTITEEERLEGLQLQQSQRCTYLRGWVEGTVLQIDIPYFLIDYCRPGNPCVRVIQRPLGFIKD